MKSHVKNSFHFFIVCSVQSTHQRNVDLTKQNVFAICMTLDEHFSISIAIHPNSKMFSIVLIENLNMTFDNSLWFSWMSIFERNAFRWFIYYRNVSVDLCDVGNDGLQKKNDIKERHKDWILR